MRLQGVEEIRLLRCMCVAGAALERFRLGDVDIVGRREHQRVQAIGDLIEVECGFATEAAPCFESQCESRTMIRMIVDRPLRKYDIRSQRREQFGESFVVCIVHNRSTIALW